jgi:hypothetical protein
MAEDEEAEPKQFDPRSLWDDKAFRQRISDFAKRQGKSVREVLEGVGLTREFAYRPAENRPAHMIMLVAQALGVSPAVLAGWQPPEPEQQLSEDIGDLIIKLNENFSQERLKILLITLAVTRSDLDPKAIAELATMMRYDWARKLNNNNQR